MTLFRAAGIVSLVKNLGRKIKETRLLKDLTLAGLAKKSGVALSTLSRIETGRMTGTLESHLRIAHALGVRLPELYAELDPLASSVELKKASDPSDRYQTSRGASVSILTSNALHKKMLPGLIHLPGGKSTKEEQSPAGTEKLLFLLKGKTDVTVGKEKIRMDPGDSLYFQASLPHTIKNSGPGQSLILSCCCPPSL